MDIGPRNIDIRISYSLTRGWWIRGFLIAVVFLLLVITLVVGYLIDPTPSGKITHANYLRLDIGMTKKEVDGILGKPGDYVQYPFFFKRGSTIGRPRRFWLAVEETRGEHGLRPRTFGTYDRWAGDHGRIVVYYDANNCVVALRYMEAPFHYKWFSWLIYESEGL